MNIKLTKQEKQAYESFKHCLLKVKKQNIKQDLIEGINKTKLTFKGERVDETWSKKSLIGLIYFMYNSHKIMQDKESNV